MEPLRKKYRQILVVIILILGGLSSLAFFAADRINGNGV